MLAEGGGPGDRAYDTVREGLRARLRTAERAIETDDLEQADESLSSALDFYLHLLKIKRQATLRRMRVHQMQEAMLDIIQHTHVNGLDGDRVADWLAAHRELWTAVYPTTHKVRDILTGLAEGTYWPDTIYVLCPVEHAPAVLRAGKEELFASEVNLEPADQSLGLLHVQGQPAVVLLWWD